MKTSIENSNISHNGKTIAGIIILVFGSLLLFDQLNLFVVPAWLFSWPMWMIAYGLYMGGKYNFRKPIWIWIIVLGTAFLLTENIPDADRAIWPISIIGVGAWLVMKQHNHTSEDSEYTITKHKEI